MSGKPTAASQLLTSFSDQREGEVRELKKLPTIDVSWVGGLEEAEDEVVDMD